MEEFKYTVKMITLETYCKVFSPLLVTIIVEILKVQQDKKNK